MTRYCMIAAAVATTVIGVDVARAEKPSLDEVKTTVLELQDAVLSVDEKPTPAAANPTVAAEIAVAPFAYAGFAYSHTDPKVEKGCKKKFGPRGKVKADKLGAFLDCASIGIWGGALDPDAEWTEANPKKLPKQLEKYRAQLARLAKDHAIVISHFVPAGPADYWNVYGATKDASGKVRIDTLITVNRVWQE